MGKTILNILNYQDLNSGIQAIQLLQREIIIKIIRVIFLMKVKKIRKKEALHRIYKRGKKEGWEA